MLKTYGRRQIYTESLDLCIYVTHINQMGYSHHNDIIYIYTRVPTSYIVPTYTMPSSRSSLDA